MDKEYTQEASKREEESLEEIFAQLEETVLAMEKEDVSLEDSFRLYHRGLELLKLSNEKIDTVEKRMLILDEEGEAHEF